MTFATAFVAALISMVENGHVTGSVVDRTFTILTMLLSEKSQTVLGPSLDGSLEGPTHAIKEAAEVACAYLNNTGLVHKAKHFKVFYELANETLLRIGAGKPLAFTAQNLKAGVDEVAAKEASGWLSPLWARLLELEPGWQEGLVDTARQLGKTYIPKLGKLPGSPAHYFIESVPIVNALQGDPVLDVPAGGLHYTPEAVAAPAAWLNKALLAGVVPFSGKVSWSIGGALALSFIALMFSGWLIWTIGLRVTRPVSPADFSVVALLVFPAFTLWRGYVFLDQLFTFRIAPAPDLLTPLSATNVTLELRRYPVNSELIELAFVRYSATCPVCGGVVELYDGRHAFPDRLVGRCRRSAREHVFSFDPALKIGHPLRSVIS